MFYTNDLIEKIKEIILQAGEIALENFGKNIIVENKSDNSPVSNVDKEIDIFIEAHLKALAPDIPVISEEGYNLFVDQNTFWLVDPIDGTRSYIKHQETYTINIALIENYKPKLGFIYMPSRNLLYYTDLTPAVIVVDNNISFCIKSFIDKDNDLTAAVSSLQSKKLDKFVEDHNITQVISIPSSIKLCLVADGSADIYPRFGRTMEWDTAAGHAILKAVGGDILCDNGQPLMYGKKHFENPNFFACNEIWLKKQLLSKISSLFNS